MTAARDILITGLRNAHAMESQAQELMERQIERTDEFPEVKQRLEQHLEETKSQMERLDGALKKLDASPSIVKDAALGIGANIAAAGHAMADDEILKNALANNAFEHYEIAAYKSLLTMCRQAGIKDFVEDLKQSLDEEEKMAKWVDANLEGITLQYLDIEGRHGEAA